MNLQKFRGFKKPAAVILTLLLLIVGTAAVYAASSTPGSEEDPVVTKSYVDDAITEALGSGSGSSGASYKVVELEAGQSLLGGEGTEIILRSGKATAIDNGSNGVSDITSGTDLMSGDNVKLNHLLLVPRDDGRGIKVSTDAYAMVRGSYKLS